MPAPEPIAIVGFGGVFPGGPGVDAFWRNVAAGIDAGRPVPAGRWTLSPEKACRPGELVPDKTYSTWGCYLDEIPVAESDSLAGLDPVCHLALHAAGQAIESARWDGIDRQRVGVILGHIVLPTEATSALARDTLLRSFEETLLRSAAKRDAKLRSSWSLRNRRVAALPAEVIAETFGFGGPAFTLDAACASSLYALKLAVEELQSGRADTILAGGLSRPDCQYTQIGFAQLQALSKRGRCAPLSAAADGLVVGEGAGLFVLKRLSEAVAAGDRIEAVIAGIGLSNDRGANLLAPHSEGQLRAMRAAYEQADWSPEDVDYIECHATGTPTGDAVELDSLHQLWRDRPSRPGQCVLGAVKSNVGHLLTGAGGAGLMKLLGMFRRQELWPIANYVEPAAALSDSDSPFRVVSEAEPWPAKSHRPRRAAINAFGFGGINAHVLIEEHLPGRVTNPQSAVRAPKSDDEVVIIGIEATIGPWQNLAAVRERLFGEGESSFRSPLPRCGGEGTGGGGATERSPAFAIDRIEIPLGEFRIPPRELPDLLPQQQLMLQVTAAALERAGVGRSLGDRAGVFLGVSLDPNTTNFHCRWAIAERAAGWTEQLGLALSDAELDAWIAQLQEAFGPPLTPNRVMGNLAAITASRIAREFDIGGPSFTISADEDSGLHALQTALQALQRGELDLAVVGAVEFGSDVRAQLADLSVDESVVASDGAMSFILKRRQDALRAGNPVLAKIDSPPRLPLRGATDSPTRSIAHRLGFALATSEMTNLLHSVLCLLDGFDPTASAPVLTLRDRRDGLRRIVTNGVRPAATIVVEEIPNAAQAVTSLGSSRQLFVLEGNSREELLAQLDEATRGEGSIAERALRWQSERRAGAANPQAIVLVARSGDELRAAVEEARSALRENRATFSERVSYEPHPLGLTGNVAFVFPGSGNAFLGMGRELLTAFPGVLARQHAENEQLRGQFRPELCWDGPSTEAIGRDHKAMIFGQVALGTAMCDLLAAFGVRPAASLGYSLGESAALFGLRAWRDRDGMLERMRRSTLFGSDLVAPFDAARKAWQVPADQPVPWVSGVINAPIDAVRDVVSGLSKAYLLIVNTPHQCVIGGDERQVAEAVRRLGTTLVPFSSPSTVHCPILNEVRQAYVELHRLPTTPPEGVDFYSSANGARYDLSEDAAAAAILAQAVDTVDFPAVIRRAHRDGVRLFLEIGPGNSCTRMIDEILSDVPHRAAAVCPATADPVGQFLSILAQLIAHRVPVDLSPLFDETALARLRDARERIVTPTGPRKWGELPMPVLTGGGGVQRCGGAGVEEMDAGVADVDFSGPLAPVAGERVRVRGESPLGHESGAVAVDSSVHDDSAFAVLAGMLAKRAEAHAAFLHFAARSQVLVARLADGGAGLIEEEPERGRNPERHSTSVKRSPPLPDPLPRNGGEGTGTGSDVSVERSNTSSPAPPHTSSLPPSAFPLPPSAEPPRALDYDQCLAYAIGRIGDVLGPKFAAIDEFPTRVRLPDVPLMLVDRIVAIEGEPLSMSHGRVVTEHDIHADDWYLDCGRIPTSIAVESGQADLFLSGWLGIDFETRGEAVYRLLDAVVTFHDALPGPGRVIRYDIRINNFFRQGSTWLFRFEFDATVDGRPLLTMREGCAGFFSAAELAGGKGIVHTALDRQPRPGKRPADWSDPVPMAVESYSDRQIAALRDGDLEACFGASFRGLAISHPLTLPAGRLRLVDRVLHLDPTAGKYGLGMIRAEADIHPDDWFLTCHFCDDQVMPGTLMYECCLHTLRIYLLRMGWIGESGEIVCEPVPEVRSRLKCRGQVLASTKKVWYEVTIKEVGYGERNDAYCIADALMYADGKPIVEITDMSIRLTGLTREKVKRLWSSTLPSGGRKPPESGVVRRGEHTQGANAPRSGKPLFDTDRITAFAIGKPSVAFGDRYRVFDEERKIARLPGPPFQFLDRIVSIEHCEPWKLAAGGVIVAEYDVPPDAWYFAANRQPTMPFAVLLETALQPCGWLAGYLGSALTSDTDLSFRNLGGKATQFQDVTPDSGTLATTVKITSVSQSGGMIIQHYEFDLKCRGESVYRGTTYFGFFSKESLANQIGIRDARLYQPTADELARAESLAVSHAAPFPSDEFRMVDRVEVFLPDGGPHKLGFLRGTIDVDPGFWFFKAHFYQDPVWPGSLGLESFLQLLKVYAATRWGHDSSLLPRLGGEGGRRPDEGVVTDAAGSERLFSDESSPVKRSPPHPDPLPRGGGEGTRQEILDLHFQTVALDAPHEWVYRGQVIPQDKTVTVEVVVTAVDDANHLATASGFLRVDGRVIYQMIDFTVQLISF